jgi:hypothetical protein
MERRTDAPGKRSTHPDEPRPREGRALRPDIATLLDELRHQPKDALLAARLAAAVRDDARRLPTAQRWRVEREADRSALGGGLPALEKAAAILTEGSEVAGP